MILCLHLQTLALLDRCHFGSKIEESYYTRSKLFLYLFALFGVRQCMDNSPVPGLQVQPSAARLRWRQAVRRISQILRLRRRWASLGRHLQLPRIQSLVSGLERRGGRLIRRRAASR